MPSKSVREFKAASGKVRRKLARMDPEITADLKSVISRSSKRLLIRMRSYLNRGSRAGRNVGTQSWRDKYAIRGVDHLRDALQAKVSKNGLTGRVGLLGDKRNKRFFYWRFLEFGTKFIPRGKYSFIAPAWRPIRQEVRNEVKSETKRAFGRAVRDV